MSAVIYLYIYISKTVNVWNTVITLGLNKVVIVYFVFLTNVELNFYEGSYSQDTCFENGIECLSTN